MRPENPCRVYWGSHGCDLERGHTGWHACGLVVSCSHMNEIGTVVEYWNEENNEWSFPVTFQHAFGDDLEFYRTRNG